MRRSDRQGEGKQRATKGIERARTGEEQAKEEWLGGGKGRDCGVEAQWSPCRREGGKIGRKGARYAEFNTKGRDKWGDGLGEDARKRGKGE